MQKQLAGMAPDRLNEQRRAFNKDFVQSGLLRDYSVQAVKAKTATQAFTESLVKQDIGVRKAIAGRKMFSDVLREQINLQKMLAVQWSKGPGGTVSADVIMPKGVDGQVNRLSGSLRENVKALAENKVGTAEFAQAADVARMRLGLFNEIVASSADNMIKWGKNTQWAGRQLMVGFTVPFAAFAAFAAVQANNVDKEMTRILKVYDTMGTTAIETERELAQVRNQSMSQATQIAKKYGAAVQDTLKVEAELAATGLQGQELMKASAEVMRIATLGEMDYQKATEMTIALQTAFRLNTEQTTDAMNFMNSVENATSLSLQDFADATPRAAAALAGLGVTVKEMGVLLVAMKERGIDATEGANALKSATTRMLNPTNKAVQSFQAMGISLKDISEQGQGNLFKTLELMGAEFKRVGLSAFEQQKLIADAFGTYQFNRLNAALQGITDKSGQTGKAFELMGQSAEEAALNAQQELDRAANSISGKFKRAVEGLKAEIATIGEPFLKMGTTVIQIVSGILKAFNSLPSGIKMFGLVVATIAALAGPIIMSVGLMANLIGQVLKLGTSLVMLTTRYRTMTTEQKAQQLLSKQNSLLWSSEASSAQLLSAQLANLTSRFEALAVAQARANGMDVAGFGAPTGFIGPQGPTDLTQDKNGKWRRANGTFASAAEVKNMQTMQASAENIASASASTEKNWGGIATGAAATAATAGVLGSMVAPTNDMLNNFTNIALLAAAVGPLVVKGLRTEKVASIGQNLIGKLGFGKGGKLATGATSTFKVIGTRIAALGPQLLRLAGPIGLLGSAALMVFLKIRSEQKKSDEAMKKIGESTKDWADILGYVRIETGKIKDAQGNQVDTIDTMADKLRQANAPLVDRLRTMKKLNQEQKLLDTVTMEGIKVRQSGGTAAQAKQAMKIALVAAGFTEQEVDVTILPKISIDMSNQQQVIDQQIDLMSKQLEDSFRLRTQQSKWEGFNRFITGSKDELNTSGRRQAWNLANQFWETFQQQDQQGRLKYFNEFQKGMESSQNKIWDELTDNSKKRLTEAGIENMQQLQQIVADSYNLDVGDYYSKYTQEQIQAVTMMRTDQRTAVRLSAEAEQELAQQIAKNNGMTDKEIENIKTLNDVRGIGINMARVTVEQAKANYEQTLKEAAARGGLSDAEKLNALNQFRLAAGLKAATSLSQGFGTEVAKTTTELNQNSNSLENQIMKAEEWASAWVDARKSAMSGAQDMAFQQADKLFDQQAQAEIDAIQRRGDQRQDALDETAERAEDRFDARQESQQKRFDSQSKALDKNFDSRAKSLASRWDTAMENFDNRWEARKDAASAYYDNRVKKIQDAIEAEEKAEDIRQKIFEAEKERISRLAEIANQRIDFNIALNTGNLDEAAKVFNNMQSQQDQWALDDASELSQTGSDKRRDALQAQIDQLNAQKDAKLKQLDQIEEAEKKKLEARKAREEEALAQEREREEQALREHQERQAKALQSERDRYNKAIQVQRDALTAETAASVRAHQSQLDDRKAKLELELLAIRASTPRNKAEYDAQIKQIEAAYQKYGVRLQGYGRAWTGYIGSYLTANVNAAAISLQNDVNWKQIAAEVTKQFTEGAFGMSVAEFGKWITTGQLPAKSVFGKGGALSEEDALRKQRQMERDAFHTGGIIGGRSPGRVGKSGSLHSDEVNFTGLTGEAVLNRKATRTLGEDFIHAANSGNLGMTSSAMKGTSAEGLGAGPGGLGMVGALGAGLAGMLSTTAAVAMTKAAMGAIGMTGGSMGPGKAGKYGQVNFDAEQLQNAATIASVGRNMGMTKRDIEIGIMTAITESMLRNIRGGDRDSVGLFQQRPSQGWGSVEQIMDPNYSSRKFFDGLKKVKGRASLDPWVAAQKVQRSAFSDGSNYRKYWDEAMAIFGGMGTQGTGNVISGPFGPANRTGTAAINWASSRIGDAGWYALCQKFVRMALGAGGGFPSAISAWRGAKYKHGINNPNQVPAGVPVYWSGGKYGHVALSTGNGRIISTDYPKRGYIGTGTISGLTSDWRRPLLGWTEDINGKRIYGLPGLNTGGFTLNDGFAKLHEGEAVLTKPLTAELKDGIGKIDQAGSNEYTVTVDLRGSTIESNVDIERAINDALDKRESKLGRKRKIGK
jgi:TP901 family phage tail tape measure protein